MIITQLCSLPKNNRRTSAFRLMDVKFLKVKEQSKKGVTEVQHISITLMCNI